MNSEELSQPLSMNNTIERVSLTYASTQEGEIQERELPLHLVVLGDFKGQASDVPIEERDKLDINSDNFFEVLADINPQIDTTVPNKLVKPSEKHPNPVLPIHLSIDSMYDFSPEGIIRQVPELKALMDFRRLLLQLKEQPENSAQIIRAMFEVNPKGTVEFVVMQQKMNPSLA